jgi:hypothetical protein
MAETDGHSEPDAVVLVLEEEETAPVPVSERVEEVAGAAAVLSMRGASWPLRGGPRSCDLSRETWPVSPCSLLGITAFGFANCCRERALDDDARLGGGAHSRGRLDRDRIAALLLRGGPSSRNWRRVVAPAAADNRQEAVDEAGRSLRTAIDEFGEAVAQAAEQKIAAAVLPLAGGMVEVGEDMVEATDEVIEKVDEINDAIEESVPGGMSSTG